MMIAPRPSTTAVSPTGIVAILDRLLHPQRRRQDPDEVRQARVLAGTILVLLVAGIPAAVVTLLGHSPTGLAVATVCVVAGYLVCLAMLRFRGGSLSAPALIACGPVLATFAYLAAHAGGSATVTNPWHLAIVLFAMYFVGARTGVALACLLAFEVVGSATLEHCGLALPAVPLTPKAALALSDSFALLAIGAIGALYASSRTEAHRVVADALASVAGSEARLVTLIENTTDIIGSFDERGRIVAFNTAYGNYYRRRNGRQPTLGEGGDMPATEQGARWRGWFERALAGERVLLEQAYDFDDGRIIMEISLSPIPRVGGGVDGVTLFGRDITARREGEEKVRRLYQEIESTHRQVAALDRIAGLGRLSAELAHELKTPIAATTNSLDSATHLLRELTQSVGDAGVTDDDLHEIARELTGVVGIASSAIQRVGRIIQGVREHTQGMNSTSSVEFRVLDRVHAVHALVGHLLVQSQATLDTGGVAPDAVLQGDIGKFDQILLNLVVNAIEAGVAIGRGAVVKIATTGGTGSEAPLVVSVEDDGPGLSAEARTKLFQPMFTTKANGVGLGLAISREIAQSAFGGSLDLVSTAAGARFELRCGTAAPVQTRPAFAPGGVS